MKKILSVAVCLMCSTSALWGMKTDADKENAPDAKRTRLTTQQPREETTFEEWRAKLSLLAKTDFDPTAPTFREDFIAQQNIFGEWNLDSQFSMASSYSWDQVVSDLDAIKWSTWQTPSQTVGSHLLFTAAVNDAHLLLVRHALVPLLQESSPFEQRYEASRRQIYEMVGQHPYFRKPSTVQMLLYAARLQHPIARLLCTESLRWHLDYACAKDMNNTTEQDIHRREKIGVFHQEGEKFLTQSHKLAQVLLQPNCTPLQAFINQATLRECPPALEIEQNLPFGILPSELTREHFSALEAARAHLEDRATRFQLPHDFILLGHSFNKKDLRSMTPEDFESALSWYRRAGEAGDPSGYFHAHYLLLRNASAKSFPSLLRTVPAEAEMYYLSLGRWGADSNAQRYAMEGWDEWRSKDIFLLFKSKMKSRKK